MSYDTDNVFAKILRGELPCDKVYEDADVVAMMDIFPQSRGHVLVVPKVASRNLLDADPAALGALMAGVQRVAKAVLAATGADGIKIAQFNEAPAGQTVFHLHFHVIPVYDGVPLTPHNQNRTDAADSAALAKEIAALIA